MPWANKYSNYNFIDVFAGAGGLSEGFLQAGFRPVAHVEMNEYAAKTLETRSAYYYLKNSGSSTRRCRTKRSPPFSRPSTA